MSGATSRPVMPDTMKNTDVAADTEPVEKPCSRVMAARYTDSP